MILLDGKLLSEKIKQEVKQEVEELKKQKNITPGLAVVLVGNDQASLSYVSNKAKSCENVGIYSIVHKLPQETTQEELIKVIEDFNKNQNIDGILVQLPLPKHINTAVILETIDYLKDVDGFHSYNVGKMVSNLDSFIPATPFGIMKIFQEYNIDVIAKNVLVIGSSDIVGKPIASLLINAKATVSICNSKTKDLKFYTLNSDIIIVATGVVNLLKQDMIKENTIVIDVGINRLDNGKIVGDADFENIKNKCSFITPVPGGVGPMTIAMLLKNTLKATNLRKERKKSC